MSRGRIAVCIVLAGLGLCSPASAAIPGRDRLNAARDAAASAYGELKAEITIRTRTFVAEYSVNDRYAIRAASIAARRSSRPQVQTFAGILAADARASESELRRLVHEYNVDVTLAAGLDFRRRGMIDELNSTPAFTRRYLEQQVLVKKEQRILLKLYAGSGKIVAIKEFAERRLRKIEDLLATLERLQRQS